MTTELISACPLRSAPSNLVDAYARIAELESTNERLQREVQDLQIALQTSNEHNDLTQEHFYRLSAGLTAEMKEHHAAEAKLEKLVAAITREKGDLEIMLQILIEQGDQSAEEGESARIDGLTQIANRRRFDEFLQHEWERHLADQQMISLLVCDVDHFKLFNDSNGHQAGDECLKAVAHIIYACFRTVDLVARYGGEEFAVILPRTGREAAVCAAERLRESIEYVGIPHPVSPVSDRVTMSIGVACATPRLTANSYSLIQEADRSLYLAKHQGRNRVAFT